MADDPKDEAMRAPDRGAGEREPAELPEELLAVLYAAPSTRALTWLHDVALDLSDSMVELVVAHRQTRGLPEPDADADLRADMQHLLDSLPDEEAETLLRLWNDAQALHDLTCAKVQAAAERHLRGSGKNLFPPGAHAPAYKPSTA